MPITVLVVDDEPLVSAVIRRALEGHDIVVTAVEQNGAAQDLLAAWAAGDQHLDLIHMDHNRRHGDGRELLAWLRESDLVVGSQAVSEIPLVVVSGALAIVGDLYASATPPVPTMDKPFTVAMLLEHYARGLAEAAERSAGPVRARQRAASRHLAGDDGSSGGS